METTGPKYQNLYRQIKDQILRGALPPGSRLPSRRTTAEQWNVSVITVEHAYRQLTDEGYIYAKERSGYYVRALPDMRPPDGEPPIPLRHLPEEPAPPEDPNFPYTEWVRTLRYVMSEYGPRLVGRSPNRGCARLRNALADYLLRYRGMHAQPEQIIIGSGSEQLYDAVVRLLGSDRTYAVESPSYAPIESAYRGAGARVDRLRLGADGIESTALAETTADILHVTPFHSWPTGTTADAPKRYEYLAWAKSHPNRWIIEDDFDSEFSHTGTPLETLYSMDKDSLVIYINTFSKSLAPSMRMGYMILPDSLLPLYDRVLGQRACSVPLLEQYALAEFIRTGRFEQHLNRKRRRLSEPV